METYKFQAKVYDKESKERALECLDDLRNKIESQTILEKGKWYTPNNSNKNGWMICFQGLDVESYGFSNFGDWYEDLKITQEDLDNLEFVEVPNEFVEKMFLVEAKKRYSVEMKIHNTVNDNIGKVLEEPRGSFECGELRLKGCVETGMGCWTVYQNGKWAEVAEEVKTYPLGTLVRIHVGGGSLTYEICAIDMRRIIFNNIETKRSWSGIESVDDIYNVTGREIERIVDGRPFEIIEGRTVRVTN